MSGRTLRISRVAFAWRDLDVKRKRTMRAMVRVVVSGFVLAVTTQSWSNEIGGAEARTKIARPVYDHLLNKFRPGLAKEMVEGVLGKLSTTK